MVRKLLKFLIYREVARPLVNELRRAGMGRVDALVFATLFWEE